MNKQDENKFEVLKFLQENFIVNLSYTDGEKPYISILLYHIDENFNIYFATHSDSLKVKILKKNPTVSLNIWEHNNMMIQANGEASPLTDEDKKEKVLDKLAESANKKADFWPPIFRIAGKDYEIFKIELNWMRKLDLKQDTISQVDDPYTIIKL